jgi:TolB-like protein
MAGAAVEGFSVVMVRGGKGEESHAAVPDTLCRAHLQRVTSSTTFARAEQLRRLLEWLGNRSFAPSAGPPTEKEIGELVLRRRDFDPQTDSLVRKEMCRLREKLMLYYSREGVRDRVRIRHLGGYLLGFAWSETLGEEPATAIDSPCLLILPLRSQPDLNQYGIRLAEELLVRMGEAGNAKLVSPTTALSYLGRVGDIRDFAAECGADYVVEGSLETCDGQLRATLWFVNGRSGRTERAGRFAGPDPDELARLATLWLQGQIDQRESIHGPVHQSR